MPHFDMAWVLAATIGLLTLISICLLVFVRLHLGSIVAFLVAGLVTTEIRDLPTDTAVALREFAELGVILLLFLIGLETTPRQLRELGRNALIFGVPQITVSAAVIGNAAAFVCVAFLGVLSAALKAGWFRTAISIVGTPPNQVPSPTATSCEPLSARRRIDRIVRLEQPRQLL